jgi:hypothetical protein
MTSVVLLTASWQGQALRLDTARRDLPCLTPA